MPRSGVNGTYSLPPGVGAYVPGTTILSAPENSAMQDIAQTFNTATPLQYGGLGNALSAPVADSIPFYDVSATQVAWLSPGTGLSISGTTLNAAQTPAKDYIYGLTLSTNGSDASNDIDIAAGEASSDASTPTLITLESALTKRLDAVWSVGTNQGMLDTGAVANSLYYLFLIERSDTSVVDVLASLSSTSPSMPANYDRKRLIGRVTRAAGVNAVPVMYAQPPIQIAGTAPVFGCRAWVSFSGTSGNIIAQGNVASITKNAVGDYTINFTQAMPDINYAATANVSASYPSDFAGIIAINASQSANIAPSTTSMRVAVRTVGNVAIDYPYISVTVFR